MPVTGKVRPYDPDNPPVPTAENRAAARQWMDEIRARIRQQDALQDARLADLLNRPLSPLRKLPVITWIKPAPIPTAFWSAARFIPGRGMADRPISKRGRITRPAAPLQVDANVGYQA